jgi:hypothetical protein
VALTIGNDCEGFQFVACTSLRPFSESFPLRSFVSFVVKGLVSRSRAITRSPDKDARRKIAALQTVIVPCRWPTARALSAVEGDRYNRESNDLNRRSPRMHPTRPFFNFYSKQRRLAKSTHGWPNPKPSPNPRRQRVAKLKKPRSAWLSAVC